MTTKQGSRLTKEKIPENLYFLYEIVGPELFEKIIDTAGGEILYIPRKSTLEREARYAAIRQEYDGHNVGRLAEKYGYSKRHVRSILNGGELHEDR